MTIKIVNSKNSASEACTAILEAFKKYHYVRVKIERESRTLKQNAWTHQAYKMLSAQGDMTQSQYRNYCKYEYGLSIRAADDPEFATLMRPMLKSLVYEDRLKAMSFVDVTSTFDVDQMISYINEIIHNFSDKQLPNKNWEDK
jgi:hypothetical protein